MKGVRLSEKSFELIKQMLLQGYSPKKVHQMLPEEIRVCLAVIHKVNNSATFDEYRGVKPEPEAPEKVTVITPHAQTKEVVDAINRTNVLLESLFQIVKELKESLE